VIIVSQKALGELPDEMQKVVKNALDEQFWVRTNEYQYKERLILAKAQKELGVEINTLPDDVQNKLTETAQELWEGGRRA